MPLETAAYISDLNATYPEGSDGADQGDNHIRLLKAVLKAQFPNFTAEALQATQAQLDAAVSAVTGQSALKLLAGTVDAPGASFADEPDTGIYRPAAEQFGVAIAGALVALLSAEGLVLSGNLAATGGIASSAGFLAQVLCPWGLSLSGTQTRCPTAPMEFTHGLMAALPTPRSSQNLQTFGPLGFQGVHYPS